MTFAGLKIITTPELMERGEPIQVRYTWRERLISWPWRPWVATYTRIPLVPSSRIYRMGHSLVMHPQMVDRLRTISGCQEYPPYSGPGIRRHDGRQA